MISTKKQKNNKPKQKTKKQRTFTSSELSLLPDDHHNRSLAQLFRNEGIKKQLPLQQNKKNRSQKQLMSTTKKRGKSKSRGKLDKC